MVLCIWRFSARRWALPRIIPTFRESPPQPHHTTFPLSLLFEVPPSGMGFVCIVFGDSPARPHFFLVFYDQSSRRAQTTFRRSTRCTSKYSVHFAARVATVACRGGTAGTTAAPWGYYGSRFLKHCTGGMGAGRGLNKPPTGPTKEGTSLL